MSDTVIIEMDDFNELLDALEHSPETVLPFLEDAMSKSLRAIQARVAAYPAATEGNQPGRYSLKTKRPMGYYERGRGWWYPILRPWTDKGQKFGKALGVIRVKNADVAGYKLANGGDSEMLGKSWAIAIEADKSGITGQIGNNTSYAPWVQGNKQAKIHASRGWVTLDQAVEQSRDDINGFFQNALDEWKKATFG